MVLVQNYLAIVLALAATNCGIATADHPSSGKRQGKGDVDTGGIRPYSENPSYYDNIIWYRPKMRQVCVRPINHVKCYHFNWPIGSDFNRDRTAPSDAEAGAKLWRAVFAGAASIRFHRSTTTRAGGLREGFGLAPEGQRHLQSMREFVAAVHLFTMEPHNNLLLDRTDNDAYCLAEPGRQYAVFFTDEGDHSVRLRLSTTERLLELRWLDVATSRWKHQATLAQRVERRLRAPGTGHWVAVLGVLGP